MSLSCLGFQSFGGTTEIVSLKVVGGYATYIAVDLVIALNNPSQITISAGDLTFDVIMDSAGSSVGSVTLTNTVIKPGRNEMAASMKMTGTDLAALSKLLTSYLTAQTTELTVKGTATTTKIIPLQPGLAQLALKTKMVGLPANLVTENQMKMVGFTPNIWVKFYNPLDTPYTVTAVSVNVFFYNLKGEYVNLGKLAGAVSPPVTVPPKGNAMNENALALKIAGLVEAAQFLQLKGDQRKVDLYQNVSMVVGDAFHGGMYYEQKNVPVVDRDVAATAAALGQLTGANNTTSSDISSAIPSATTVVPTTTDAPTANVDATTTATATTQAADSTTSAVPEPTAVDSNTATANSNNEAKTTEPAPENIVQGGTSVVLPI